MIDSVRIFSIATNNYHEFEESFYSSFQNLFLPTHKKEFIIFTDDVNLDFYKGKNITPIHIDHRPWPAITLSRYEKIAQTFDVIGQNELCIFADIDLEVVSEVTNIPDSNYFGVNHPGNYFVDNRLSLENNILSQAYVDLNYLPHQYAYIQGCLWGGIGDHFKKMIGILQGNVRVDLFNGIIARWHDESHLNKFCIDNFSDFEILSSSYAYPENWQLPIQKIIIHKDKNMEKFPRFEGA